MDISLQIDELKALLKSAGSNFKSSSLDQLLGWGEPVNLPHSTADESLLGFFGVSANTAFYTAIADGLEPSAADCWIRADPVSLQAGMSRVFLVASGSPDFSNQQRTALEDELNAHFTEDGLQFLLPNNQRWYIRLDGEHPQNQSRLLPPPRQLLGEDISTDTAAMGKFWQSCFTEIQMLLFTQPYRQHREARGQAPISGLWLWGGGETDPKITPMPGLSCSGSGALLQGLALSAEVEWQEQAHISAVARQLIHWSGDQQGTALEQLQQLESQIFIPLLDAVSAGATLTLTAADSGRWVVRKRIKWPWKKQSTARSILVGTASNE